MKARRKRVVITGMGMVTPLGHNVADTWKNLASGTSGVRPIMSFDPAFFPTRIAAEVQDFDPRAYMNEKALRSLDRPDGFAVAAGRMAFEDSGIDLDSVDRERVGIYMGAGMFHYETQDLLDAAAASMSEKNTFSEEKFGDDGYRRIFPLWVIRNLNNMALCQIAIQHRIQGPNATFGSMAEAGAQALGEAVRCIQNEEADIVLSGGSSFKICPNSLARFVLLDILSKNNDAPEKACRPFDMHRDGTVLGEGAGIVVLEGLEHARARGARIHAELDGYGCAGGGGRLSGAEQWREGISASMRAALAESGLAPNDIDCINAGATGDPDEDAFEAEAIHDVFGDYARRIPVHSNKSMIGHLMAAAEPVDVISSVLAIQHQRIPPLLNHQGVDPMCNLNLVRNEAKRNKMDAVLSNSYGPGGPCVSLVLKRFEE